MCVCRGYKLLTLFAPGAHHQPSAGVVHVMFAYSCYSGLRTCWILYKYYSVCGEWWARSRPSMARSRHFESYAISFSSLRPCQCLSEKPPNAVATRRKKPTNVYPVTDSQCVVQPTGSCFQRPELPSSRAEFYTYMNAHTCTISLPLLSIAPEDDISVR